MHGAWVGTCRSSNLPRGWSLSHWEHFVRDLNTATIRHDERRIEVIANGLPLWNGQLAVDTTLVSPLGTEVKASVQAYVLLVLPKSGSTRYLMEVAAPAWLCWE